PPGKQQDLKSNKAEGKRKKKKDKREAEKEKGKDKKKREEVEVEVEVAYLDWLTSREPRSRPETWLDESFGRPQTKQDESHFVELRQGYVRDGWSTSDMARREP
ncbi:hypothetical protein P7K49_040723, partial [Saguinus oedipus]